MAGVAPPSGGGGGGAASAVGSAALHGAQRGAAIAQKGVVSLTIYVQRNPLAVSALCCLVGLALSVISVLSIVGVARMGDGENWSPRDSLQMFYQCIFGFVLVLIDVREQWGNAFFGLQTKLFTYCNFLASQTGRACFYFYVGSISLFLLPSSDLWKIVYFVLGGWLCLLGAFIAHFDDDDLYSPQYLDVMLQGLQDAQGITLASWFVWETWRTPEPPDKLGGGSEQR
ncbi:unnamed protein product [Durusdinium trenchii]|uniref:Uncharacterized protein n=1 Tax=Durusdinium trenchii TaxID=1381693 RepID=A0ABP0NX73_9DINO